MMMMMMMMMMMTFTLILSYNMDGWANCLARAASVDAIGVCRRSDVIDSSV